MNDREAFYAWAPPGAPWSPWAKPVLFASITAQPETNVEPPRPLPPDVTTWLSAFGRNTAIILDINGEQSVERGLQLAAHGFQPVPLFNSAWGENALVPVREIIGGLRRGAKLLAGKPPPPGAPPVFLLDASRQAVYGDGAPGQYDNRWLVFPQDFPSARILREQGIQSVILWHEPRLPSDRLREDLAHVLLRWQEDGIPVFIYEDQTDIPPEPYTISRPRGFRGLFQRFLALGGLSRNSAGGFGSVIPKPSSGHG